jgi:hypothetical protein
MLFEPGVSCMLAGIGNIFVFPEDLVAEEVVFEILPGLFGGVAFRRTGWNANQCDVMRNGEFS